MKLFLKINQKVFPLVFIITYAFLGIESVSYLGYIKKFVIFDSRFFLPISATSYIYYRYKLIVEKSGNSKFITLALRLNKLFFPMILIFYLMLEIMETLHFKNYVFSAYHVQPDTLFYFVLFSLVIILIEKLSDKNITKIGEISFFEDGPRRGSEGIMKFLATTLILIVLGEYLMNNINKTFSLVIESNLFIANHLNYSYDDKMRNYWGFYYDYMKFIKEYTPENAHILIPPQQGPWFSEGNVALSRYFVYPRRVYHAEDISKISDNIDYIMIAWGSWDTNAISDYGWPKQKINTGELIYLNPKDLTVNKYFENYDPKDPKNIGGWGLIKLKE